MDVLWWPRVIRDHTDLSFLPRLFGRTNSPGSTLRAPAFLVLLLPSHRPGEKEDVRTEGTRTQDRYWTKNELLTTPPSPSSLTGPGPGLAY